MPLLGDVELSEIACTAVPCALGLGRPVQFIIMLLFNCILLVWGICQAVDVDLSDDDHYVEEVFAVARSSLTLEAHKPGLCCVHLWFCAQDLGLVRGC